MHFKALKNTEYDPRTNSDFHDRRLIMILGPIPSIHDFKLTSLPERREIKCSGRLTGRLKPRAWAIGWTGLESLDHPETVSD